MIDLKLVTDKNFSKVYERLIDAFPYEERRDEADEKKCFLKEQFNFFDRLIKWLYLEIHKL